MRLMLLGAPGSGRGALIGRIAADRHLPLVADEGVTLDRLRERLSAANHPGGFVLGGIPEDPEQAAALDLMLSELGLPLDLVLQIEVERDALKERLTSRLSCRSCGATCTPSVDPPRVAGVCDRCGGPLRSDPVASGQTLEQRLRRYERRTRPLLDYYRKTGRLRHLRGEAEPDDLYAAARRIMDSLQTGADGTADWLPQPAAPKPDAATPAADAGGRPTGAKTETAAESGAWKRAAENRGRIKRRPATAGREKGWRGKPRR